METSDSECFESADEDFCSDEETQIKQKKDAKNSDCNTGHKLIENAVKLSIGDDAKSDIDNKIQVLVDKENITQKDGKSTYSKNDAKIKEDNTAESSVITQCKNTLEENVISQARTECWEPGMSYDETKINNQTKRPEFGVPPASLRGCWVPRNQRKENAQDADSDDRTYQVPPAVSTSKDINVRPGETSQNNVNINITAKTTNETSECTQKQNPRRPEFGIPPARTTCWIPGVTNVNQKPNPRRPEFGIPPARTTCWVPGVTNVNRSREKFEPHPAYLELMKKRQNIIDDRKAEENMWENEGDWGDFDTAPKEENKAQKTESSQQFSCENNQKLENNDKVCSNKNVADENMWNDDDWEPIDSNQEEKSTMPQNMQENLIHPKQVHEETPATQAKEESSWSGWGNWGLSSVLSTATILTNQVSQGISNVLETGIGAPDPEELARINKLEKAKIKEIPSNEEVPDEKRTLGFGLGNLVQGVTKLVETTGNKVISGGLDTLETIGKKTMEVLQENDPGLKKKRAFLKLDDDKPILSHVLREAKEKAELENKELEKKHFARKANYETLFDDHQGLVHLEALEMLSKQCDIKLESLLDSNAGSALNDMQETLDQVKELCELPEEDDEETLTMDEIKERLESAVSEININITYKKLLATWEEVEEWLLKVNLKICNKNELHQQAIESLAQLTALAVEQFHKTGELLLIKEHRSTADEADSLTQLTMTVTTLIGIVAAKFSEKLNMIAVDGTDKEDVNSLITNVFFEAANSSSYIQDAFQLLIPVLQVGAV